MTGRIIVHPVTGQSFHIGGCLRPEGGHPRANLALFKTPAWPKARPSCNYAAAATDPLSKLWGNDRYGDCVDVALFRNSAVKRCNGGTYDAAYVDDDVLGFYSRNTGFIASDPSTDQGSDPISAMQYAGTNGLLPDGTHKVIGFLVVDATDPEEVFSAIDVFEGLMSVCELPAAWISPPPAASGFTFDVAGSPNPNDGHATFLVDYPDFTKANISTWGMDGWLTIAAMAKYFSGETGALYVLLTQDILDKAKAKTPDGLDWPGVEAMFAAVGG